jgi:hypothetical protein
VIKEVLMAVQGMCRFFTDVDTQEICVFSGKTPYVYRHDLVALCQRNLTQKLSKPMNKIPERFLPRMLAITTRIIETK